MHSVCVDAGLERGQEKTSREKSTKGCRESSECVSKARRAGAGAGAKG
jgi:hypothetical protein